MDCLDKSSFLSLSDDERYDLYAAKCDAFDYLLRCYSLKVKQYDEFVNLTNKLFITNNKNF